MTFLPIVDRELRIKARLRSTFRIRQIAALIAILIAGFMMMIGQITSAPQQLGKGIFMTLSWLAFIFCLLEGIRNTADCLSEEKREGTLGLLFLTDLKGYDVVFGKLMATSLNSFYGLLAILPPLAITILMGGVTGGEFWRMVLLLTNTLFFSLASGMVVSALSRNQRKAWLGTLALMGLIIGAPLVLEGLIAWQKWPLPCDQILRLSPGYTFVASLDSLYKGQPPGFWFSLLLIHLLSWAFLFFAAFVLPRAWQDIPVFKRDFFWSQALVNFIPVDSAKRAAVRAQLLEINPMLWLAGRDDRQRIYLWGLIGVFLAGAFLSCVLSAANEWAFIFTHYAAMVLHLALKVWLALQACHYFAEASRSGMLEHIFATPLTNQEIIHGHMLALRRLFWQPALVLILGEVALVLVQFILGVGGNRTPVMWASGFSATWGILKLIADLFAAAYVGTWLGFSSKKAGHAITLTILLVLVLPSVLVCVPDILIAVLLIVWAQDKLKKDFRVTLANRYALASTGPIQVPPRLSTFNPGKPPIIST